MPLPLPHETLIRLEALFAPADRAAAEALLGRVEAHGQDLLRMQFAVLKLSEGELWRLEDATHAAERDWRDVLLWSGFGNDLASHREWFPGGAGGSTPTGCG